VSSDKSSTVELLDEVIRELERLMRESSAIGLDRARISMIMANCRQVRAGLQAEQPSASPSGGAADARENGKPPGGFDCADARVR
jgi:hypothetical protein